MKASKDATVAKMDKSHEHLPGMQESIETSADLTALEKELDLKTNHQQFVKAETQPRLAKPTRLRDTVRQRS